MRARGPLTIALLGASLTLGFVACGNNQHSTSAQAGSSGAGGEAGEGTAAGAAGTAGVSQGGRAGSSGRGGTGADSAGEPATGGRGGSRGGNGSGGGGTNGVAGENGGEAGTDGPGGGGAGGTPGGPVICDRFGEIVADRLADRVVVAFERAYFSDCRLSWFSTLYLTGGHREQFLNQVRHLTLDLWRCQAMAPTKFGLIYTEVPLSAAEARVLIDLYVNASRVEAGLGPSEAAGVQKELESLAAPLIDTDLADFSRSRCPDAGVDGGDNGGAGGEPGGAGAAAILAGG
jgi:hypothetical protein